MLLWYYEIKHTVRSKNLRPPVKMLWISIFHLIFQIFLIILYVIIDKIKIGVKSLTEKNVQIYK